MPSYALLFLLAVALTGCLPPADPVPKRRADEAFPVWWSSSELGIMRLSDINRELAKPFDGGIVVANQTKEKGLIANCASARELQSQGYAAQYPRDIAALGVLTAKCLALEALKSAQAARTSYMPTRPYGSRIVEILPAAFAPALSASQQTAIERATKGGEPIRMVEGTVQFEAELDEELHIAGEGWQETLALLARADFDHDSRLDWLVRADLAVERGTHRISRLFLLSRKSPDSVMHVVRELKPEWQQQ